MKSLGPILLVSVSCKQLGIVMGKPHSCPLERARETRGGGELPGVLAEPRHASRLLCRQHTLPAGMSRPPVGGLQGMAGASAACAPAPGARLGGA